MSSPSPVIAPRPIPIEEDANIKHTHTQSYSMNGVVHEPLIHSSPALSPPVSPQQPNFQPEPISPPNSPLQEPNFHEALSPASETNGRTNENDALSALSSSASSSSSAAPSSMIHPSQDQQQAELSDALNGHSHEKTASTIAAEVHGGGVIDVNAKAPWNDEAAAVAVGSQPHHAPPLSPSPLPPLIESSSDQDGNGASIPAPSPSSSIINTVDDVSMNRRASEQRRQEFARVDRWGNIHTGEDPAVTEKTPEQIASEDLARSKRLALDQEREIKWVKMVANWDRTMKHRSDKIKRRIRKGVPDSMRGAVWPRFTGALDLMRGTNNAQAMAASSSSGPPKTGPGVYARYANMHSKDQDTIARDIARTFPHHVLFRDTNPRGDPAGIGEGIGGAGQGKAKGDDSEGQSSPGRNALYHVLKAYSLHDEQVGYCQGMGFPAGLFLMYMTEEEAFWMLHCIARGEKYLLNGLWSPGFPLLFQCFYQFEQLLKKHCPKLSIHLLSQDPPIVPELYATHWFMTLFSYNLPFEVVLRIWDILLAEGPKIIFRLAIFFCKQMEKAVLKEQDFASIMDILKNLHTHPMMSDPDYVIDGALKISITRGELSKLANEYQTKKFHEQQERQRQKQANGR